MKFAPFLPVMALIACNAVSAQQVTDFRQPGDVIRLEIKFDGTDAAKVKQVLVTLSKQGPAPSTDQIGFNTSFSNDNWLPESAPLTFRVDVKIPTDVATGDYTLSVNARAENGRTSYTSGDQFQLPAFHIRNDRSFVAPKIMVTERRP
jgi:hypothetical protein